MPPRQPIPSAHAWLRSAAALRLLSEHQRQIQPELSGVFGRSGLYLQPHPHRVEPLRGHRLHTLVSLHPDPNSEVDDGCVMAGDLHCRGDALPFVSGSLALVCVMHVLETMAAPARLVEEIARVLEPEGVAMLLVLNPLGIAHLRWARRGPAAIHPGTATRWARAAGLEVLRTRYIGPWWQVRDAVALDGDALDSHEQSWLPARLRSGYLLFARKRDAALTPLRPLRLRPALHAG